MGKAFKLEYGDISGVFEKSRNMNHIIAGLLKDIKEETDASY